MRRAMKLKRQLTAKKINKRKYNATHRAKQPRAKKLKGPAYKIWAKHLVVKRRLGHCMVTKCSAKTPLRHKLCTVHKAEYRSLQLKLNNATWLKRKQQGLAGKRMVYGGKPTPWAISKGAPTSVSVSAD